jgi:hypothetical protein
MDDENGLGFLDYDPPIPIPLKSALYNNGVFSVKIFPPESGDLIILPPERNTRPPPIVEPSSEYL